MKPYLPSAEESEKIKKGDKELIDKYFLLNYDFIVMVAKSYCRKNLIQNNLYEDISQECYLYFNKFRFDNVSTFIRSIYDVAVFVRWGGERVYHQVRQGNTEILTILDQPVMRERSHGGEVPTLGETLASPVDILEEIEPYKDYTDDLYMFASLYMTEREKQAFEQFYYTDLTAREVGELLGITINGAQSLKNSYMRKLRKNSEEFKTRFLNMTNSEDYKCLKVLTL